MRCARGFSAKTICPPSSCPPGRRFSAVANIPTQAAIAVAVVVVALVAAVVAMTMDKEVSAFLSFVCGNVVGFYFSRTNHAAIGGIGAKPHEEYKGR